MILRNVAKCFFLVVPLLWAGCYSASQISRDEIVVGADYDICAVITTTGDSIALKDVSGRSGIIRDSTIVGIREDGKVARIPLSQVLSVQIRYLDAGETVFAVLGITAAVVVGAMLTFFTGGGGF